MAQKLKIRIKKKKKKNAKGIKIRRVVRKGR